MNFFYRSIIAIFCLFSFLPVHAHSGVSASSDYVHTFNDSTGIIVTQNSNYLLVGQEIEISVFVCPTKLRDVRVSIGGNQVPFNESGIALVKMPGGPAGLHTIPVEIRIVGMDGHHELKSYTIEYEVGQLSTIIDERNLNFLYAGVDNPLDIFIFGVPEDKVSVKISGKGSSIKKSGVGEYVARVSSMSGDCHVSVYADGKIWASKQFRVINVPLPTVTIDHYTPGSNLPVGELQKYKGINVGNKDFPFKVNYRISGFVLRIATPTGISKSFRSSGSEFPVESKKQLIQAASGSMIIISDIEVQTSTDSKLILPPAVFYIK